MLHRAQIPGGAHTQPAPVGADVWSGVRWCPAPQGRTALWVAIAEGQLEVARLLVEEGKADANLKNNLVRGACALAGVGGADSTEDSTEARAPLVRAACARTSWQLPARWYCPPRRHCRRRRPRPPTFGADAATPRPHSVCRGARR